MPENNNAAGEGTNTNAGENSNSGATNTEAKTGTETAGQGTGDGGGASGEGNGTGQGEAKAPQGSQSQEGDDGDPPVKPRKSPKDFIIQRQQRKIEKLQQQKAGEGGQGDDDDDDDEVLPEDEDAIVRTFEKRVLPGLKPFIEKNIEAEDNQEINDFLKDNPDFKPYEAKVRKWVNHPSRRHLPIESIFYEVAGKDLLKLGAERGRKADEEARNTQTGGGSGRETVIGEKKVADMTDDEIREKQAKLRGQSA